MGNDVTELELQALPLEDYVRALAACYRVQHDPDVIAKLAAKAGHTINRDTIVIAKSQSFGESLENNDTAVMPRAAWQNRTRAKCSKPGTK